MLGPESLAYYADHESAAAARRPEEGKYVSVSGRVGTSTLLADVSQFGAPSRENSDFHV